jgi:aspartate 1-decarboxylase
LQAEYNAGKNKKGQFMQRVMLKSKIHRARLTGTDLEYEGSITVDPILLEAADILPNEQVHVLNLNNGNRLTTYAIEGERGSGTMLLNGPAARCGMTGDIVVVLTYANVENRELADYKPKIVKVDKNNKLKK